MERVISNRLIWKLEVDGGIEDTQFGQNPKSQKLEFRLKSAFQ